MRGKILKLLFLSVFLVSFLATTVVANEVNERACYLDIGRTIKCGNSITGDDGLAYFTNTSYDVVNATSAYKINYSRWESTPNVRRGEPLFINYIVYDNKNGQYWTYSSMGGSFLNDKDLYSATIGRTVDYYPSNSERPLTQLTIKNADGLACYSKFWECKTYTHITTQYIN